MNITQQLFHIHFANHDAHHHLNSFILRKSNSFAIPLLAIGYMVEFLMCLFGNGLVLYILPRIKREDDYIITALLTLACSDLLQAFVAMPIRFIKSIYFDWFLGEYMCKFMTFIISVNTLNGIWFCVYIAFDRYINICHPFKFPFLKTSKFCKIILVCLVIFHLLLCSYHLYFFQLFIDKKKHCYLCRRKMPKKLKFIHLIVVNMSYRYILPVILLFFFYGSIFIPLFKLMISYTKQQKQQKKQQQQQQQQQQKQQEQHSKSTSSTKSLLNLLVVKILLFLVIFFTLSYFPMFLVRIGQIMNSKKLKKVKSVAFYLQTFNSALNPWIYSLCSQLFREQIKKLFQRKKKKDPTSSVITKFSLISPQQPINNKKEISQLD